MMEPEGMYRGRTALITGGTRGIGLATALVFAAHGAQTVLTHAWGSADENEVTDRIVAAGAVPVTIGWCLLMTAIFLVLAVLLRAVVVPLLTAPLLLRLRCCRLQFTTAGVQALHDFLFGTMTTRHRRIGGARTDRINSDPIRSELARQRFDEPDNRRFRGGVARRSGVRRSLGRARHHAHRRRTLPTGADGSAARSRT